jgi:hypothetical protein
LRGRLLEGDEYPIGDEELFARLGVVVRVVRRRDGTGAGHRLVELRRRGRHAGGMRGDLFGVAESFACSDVRRRANDELIGPLAERNALTVAICVAVGGRGAKIVGSGCSSWHGCDDLLKVCDMTCRVAVQSRCSGSRTLITLTRHKANTNGTLSTSLVLAD